MPAALTAARCHAVDQIPAVTCACMQCANLGETRLVGGACYATGHFSATEHHTMLAWRQRPHLLHSCKAQPGPHCSQRLNGYAH